MPVCHCLVGHPSQRRPQHSAGEHDHSPEISNLKRPSHGPVDFQHIRTVYSHPQALGQCERYISLHLPGAERQDVSSTSKAAEIVTKEGSNSRAVAISSSLAAKLHRLEVLVEGIQDRNDNSTRFFVLRNKKSVQESHNPTSVRTPSANGVQWKTLISFTLAQQPSGTLADVLQTFKDREINLTGIHSRPSLEHAWHYVFLIEVQGRREEGTDGGTMNEALEELGRKAKAWRWLGSWADRAEQHVGSA